MPNGGRYEKEGRKAFDGRPGMEGTGTYAFIEARRGIASSGTMDGVARICLRGGEGERRKEKGGECKREEEAGHCVDTWLILSRDEIPKSLKCCKELKRLGLLGQWSGT